MVPCPSWCVLCPLGVSGQPSPCPIRPEAGPRVPEPRPCPAPCSPVPCPLRSAQPVACFSPPRRQEQFQTNPDSYNGAVRENYAWSQDYSDLEIKVPVPKHIVKGKQVKRLGRFVLQHLPLPCMPSCLRSRAWSREAPQPPAWPSDRGAGRGRAWFPLFSAPAGFLGAAGPFPSAPLPAAGSVFFHLGSPRCPTSRSLLPGQLQ